MMAASCSTARTSPPCPRSGACGSAWGSLSRPTAPSMRWPSGKTWPLHDPAGRSRRSPAERYAYAVERFGLDPDSDAPARELPHHQLQWLEIAMVLAAGPSILLLDEPTAGMSPDETMQTARVLQHLNAHRPHHRRGRARRRVRARGGAAGHRAAPGPRVRRRVDGRDHRQPGRAAHLSGEGLSRGRTHPRRRGPALRAMRPATYCRASGLRSVRARSWACSAATGSARAR